jgi:hypothetical protein
MSYWKAATLVASLAALGGSADATPLPRYGLFLFSSLCGEPEGGDISGAELVIVRQRDRDRILFSYGSGPLIGTQVSALDIKGDKLTAKLTSDEGGAATVTATLSAERVVSRFTFDDAQVKTNYTVKPLVRVTDLGRPLPDCH